MSNNGIKSVAGAAAATNGRSAALVAAHNASANNSKSINQYRSEGKLPANTTTTTATTTSNVLPERTNKTTIKAAHKNDTSIPAAAATTAAHRRDNSTYSGQHQKQQQQLNSQSQLHKQTVRQYYYMLPQTTAEQQQQSRQAEADAVAQQQSVADKYLLLVYSDDVLVSGSLEALITHMVPTAEYYPERHFVFSFLLSARLFIRPHELLAQISQTWEQQQKEQQAQQDGSSDVVDEAAHTHTHMPLASLVVSASPLTQRKQGAPNEMLSQFTPIASALSDVVSAQRLQRTATQKSAQHCIRLLSEWIETFPYDFRDERLMQQVRILARKCVYIDNSLGKQVSRILQLLVQRLTALEQYEEFLQSLLTAADLTSQQHYSTSATSASASFVATSGGDHHHQTQQSQSQHQHQHHLHNPLGKSVVAAFKHSDSNNVTHHHVANANSTSAAATASNHSKSSSETNEALTHSPDVPLDIMDMCPSCAHLAHQLTAIELERLSHIGPEEFVQAFAKEYQHSVDSKTTNASSLSPTLNDMKKTRNLESYVEWFNRLSYFTATEIVKYPKKKQRVRIIEYWIETARECFNIGNFNSLMAIIAGLNLAPISRLKKTWSKVQSAKFSVLEHQMDPTSNFNSYRSTLKAAMWRSEGATDARERIIIPFFSLFVKDLYFLNEGCSNRLPNNHINFEKCSQLAKQIMEFNEWKKVSCPYEQLPHVIAFLQSSSVLNENTLSMASFECEPPENTEEKGRYKTVKAETKQQLLQQLQEQHQHQQQQ